MIQISQCYDEELQEENNISDTIETKVDSATSLEILMSKFGQHTKDSAATNDKYWKLACNVTNNDALSAISRAKTEQCKREMSSIACMIKENSLLPDIIPK